MAADKHLSVLPGSFLSAEAPVPLDALSPNPGNDFADLQSLLVNASGGIPSMQCLFSSCLHKQPCIHLCGRHENCGETLMRIPRYIGCHRPSPLSEAHWRAEQTSIAAGPIVYKTAQAALFLSNESATDAALSFTLQTVSLSNSSGSLLASYANNSVVLAFTVSSAIFIDLHMHLPSWERCYLTFMQWTSNFIVVH